MTFAATLVDEANSGIFMTPLSDEVLKDCNIFIGLYEEESDTSCGVLAASSVTDGGSTAISVREVFIEEGYDCQKARETLYRFIQDAAEIGGFSAVFCSEYISEEGQNENTDFFEKLGFFQEEKKLPLYKFGLRDVHVKGSKTEMRHFKLMDLSEKQWKQFKEEADVCSFEIEDKAYYDPKSSIFLVDDDGNVQAGLLSSIREGDIFIEGIAAYGGDESTLINDLVYWTCDAISKRFPQDSYLYMYMFTNVTYKKMLQDMTGDKAQKIGNLVSYTFEVPVSIETNTISQT